MKTIATKFAESKPRLYGSFILTLAVVLALIGRHFLGSRIFFMAFFVLTGVAVTGAFYMTFGSKAHRWFAKRTFEEQLSWKHLCINVSLGLFIYILASLLDWILR